MKKIVEQKVYLLLKIHKTVKLGYKDHVYNELTFITNKKIWIWNESLLRKFSPR